MFRFRNQQEPTKPLSNCTKEELEEELEKLRESSRIAIEFNYDEINRLQHEKKEKVTALEIQIDELTEALDLERKMRINLEMELRARGGNSGGDDSDEDTKLLNGIDVLGWGGSVVSKQDRSVATFNTAITSDSTRSKENGAKGPLHHSNTKNNSSSDNEIDDGVDEEMMKQHFSHMTFHELEATLQAKVSQVARLERKSEKQKGAIAEYEEELEVLRKSSSSNSNDHIVKELVERISHYKQKLKAKDQEMQEVSEVMTQWVQGKGEEIKKLASMIKIQKEQITSLTYEIERQKKNQEQ